MTVQYSVEPTTILYMPLSNGLADVWLRKDIAEEENEEGLSWTAEEVYFRTDLTKDEVTENFDTLYENEGLLEIETEISTEERIAALEAAVIELAEVIVNG